MSAGQRINLAVTHQPSTVLVNTINVLNIAAAVRMNSAVKLDSNATLFMRYVVDGTNKTVMANVFPKMTTAVPLVLHGANTPESAQNTAVMRAMECSGAHGMINANLTAAQLVMSIVIRITNVCIQSMNAAMTTHLIASTQTNVKNIAVNITNTNMMFGAHLPNHVKMSATAAMKAMKLVNA